MKLFVVASILLSASLIASSGCGPGENPDDILFTPGGFAYRANSHEQGVANPWPPIETTEVPLGDSADGLFVSYRDYIETKAGQTRNNIFSIYGVSLPQDAQKASLKPVNLPMGIEVTESEFWLGPRRSETVLKIEISQDVEPGEYNFEIGVEIGGKDYGKLPCTINVVSD